MLKETKRVIISLANAAKWRIRNIRLDMTWWERRFNRNFARNGNLSMLTNSTCTPESVWANEAYKILWEFEIITDHNRRPFLVLIFKKENLPVWKVFIWSIIKKIITIIIIIICENPKRCLRERLTIQQWCNWVLWFENAQGTTY